MQEHATKVMSMNLGGKPKKDKKKKGFGTQEASDKDS